MFGNRLIREAGHFVFQNPGFRTDLVNFIHNCTSYDPVDGSLDSAVFSASADVWPLMKNRTCRVSCSSERGDSVRTIVFFEPVAVP